MYKSIVYIFIKFLIASSLVFCLFFLGIAFYKPSPNFHNDSRLIVILGAGFLKNGSPVLALEKRLNKGIEVWTQLSGINHNKTFILLSGHKEEVQVMFEYLKNHDISIEYLIRDKFSYNTRDTIRYAYQKSQQLNTSPIFVSQAYHIPRILLYATVYGYDDVMYVATDRVNIPFHKLLYVSIREAFAIVLFPYFYFILNSYQKYNEKTPENQPK
ncbi:MAG: YdcF family protein [Spirochaetota bacterium]|nr:YdcF family protein [Spirochaetota bacterium]